MAPDLATAFALLERFGYLFVFFAALAEAFPFVSILVPGQAFVILAGALAATDHLDLGLVILVAIPAGILGDAAGYYLGRGYGRTLLERYGPLFRIGPRHLVKSDRLFHRYGPFALVLMRFSFLTRPIGPLLAGMSRMREGPFWVWNVVGAVAWAVGYALLGYFFGEAFLAIEGTVGRTVAIALGALVLVLLGIRFLVRRRRPPPRL